MLVKKWTASKNNMDIIKANASSQAVSSISIRQFLKFFIPSIIGLLLFVFPIPYV